jgi:hypothetical protein
MLRQERRLDAAWDGMEAVEEEDGHEVGLFRQRISIQRFLPALLPTLDLAFVLDALWRGPIDQAQDGTPLIHLGTHDIRWVGAQ